MGNRWGNSGDSVRLLFSWAPKSLQMMTVAMKLKDAGSLEEKVKIGYINIRNKSSKGLTFS